MDFELQRLSTAELVQYATPNRVKFRPSAVNAVVNELLFKALTVLQDASLEDEHGDDKSSKELEDELAALYDDSCYDLIVRILGSSAVDIPALAGAIYFLALLTAGSSYHAENLRNKMVKGIGTIRLVALMSAESEAVKCNALLAMGNLLRHCEAVYPEFLRLGGIRKLAVMVGQAHDERQHNVCMDAVVCLCQSNLDGVLEELMRTGCIGLVLEVVAGGNAGERVTTKALHVLKTMLSKTSAIQASVLELGLVKPVLKAIRSNETSSELLLSGLCILEQACQGDPGLVHRSKFVKYGGIQFLLNILKLSKEMELTVQVVRMLASIAAGDASVRQELCRNTSSIVWMTSLLTNAEHLEIEQPEHVAALRFLIAVSNSNWDADKMQGNSDEVHGHVGYVHNS